MFIKETIDFFGKPLTIETGRLAKQAHGSALVTLGETAVLVTAVASSTLREGQDFLPLTVDYMERTYSAGRIPGGFFKREGRPTEKEVLTGRIIDRPIRPLFPKGYKYDTQIVALVLSADKDNDPAIPALLGASAALTFSNIPFLGPIAAMRLGYLDGQLKVNPTYAEAERADMDLVVAVGTQGVVMVEGGARFVPEKVLVDALTFAAEAGKPLLELQERIAAKLSIQKRSVTPPPHDEALIARVREVAWQPMCDALSKAVKHERREGVAAAHEIARTALAAEFPDREKEIDAAVEDLERERLRSLVLKEGRRVDGRRFDEVRPITCDVDLLPRTHGSALFQRGETQVVVTVTLGTAEDEQRLDLLTGDATRSFMLHYNFPPFSVGETKPMRGPSRRDIGHGHLAERGVTPVLPVKDENFQYTIRVVSEVLESNGSSSMATVCGSSLALMAAGVPLKCHVGGIAMGLIKEGDDVAILTDILGDEDHLGDMDFKIVGTEEGVTAVQMDIKCSGLTRQIFETALEQARRARLHIIDRMKETISVHRPDYSPYAPRIYTITINPDRIRDLIGPGGKHIRGIQSATGATIEVNDDGVVHVAATDADTANRTIEMIRQLTDEAEVGKTYLGSVVKIAEFGAFVRILPGVEGLVHISELSDQRVRRVEDILREGDEVLVKVINIDRQGKIRLSRREAMKDREAGGEADEEQADDRDGDRGSGRAEGRREDRRDDRRDDHRGRRR